MQVLREQVSPTKNCCGQGSQPHSVVAEVVAASHPLVMEQVQDAVRDL